MRLVVGLLAALLLIAACGSTSSPMTLPAVVSQRPATPRPSRTPPSWPLEFEETFCVARSQNTILTEDMVALQEAFEAGDLEAVALYAYTLQASVGTIDLPLKLAPKWESAAPLVAAWRKLLKAEGPAFEKIEAAANAGNKKKLTNAVRDLERAAKQLPGLTKKLETFLAETGFTCP